MSPDVITLPDTNTILRYLLKDHPELSARASEYWEAVREGNTTALLTEGVVMECVYVLQRFYKVPRERIARELAIVLSYKGLRRDGIATFAKALEVYRLRNIDFVDCLLVAREIEGTGRVFSFDLGIQNALASIRASKTAP